LGDEDRVGHAGLHPAGFSGAALAGGVRRKV
jgi:hypothetical protein